MRDELGVESEGNWLSTLNPGVDRYLRIATSLLR